MGTGLTGTGSGGADTLLSAGGANTLIGLGGDDLYYVNHTGDSVTETAGGGYDTVVATVDYTMPANVEALYLIGTGLTGTGSAGADTLITVGANTLAGSVGNDTFVFFSDHANGATVVDFDGLGAAQGDTLIFSGFGTAAQGATFTSLGHDSGRSTPASTPTTKPSRSTTAHRSTPRTFSSCEAVAALLSGGIRAHASLWRGVRCRLAASGLCRAIPSRLARASEKWELVLGKITKNEKLERDNHSKLG